MWENFTGLYRTLTSTWAGSIPDHWCWSVWIPAGGEKAETSRLDVERAAHYWTWSQNHMFNHIWLEWLLVHILLAMLFVIFGTRTQAALCSPSGFSARSLKVFRGHLRLPFLLLGLIGVKELTLTSLLCLYLRQQNTAGPPGSPAAGRPAGRGGKRKEESRCGPPCWACK